MMIVILLLPLALLLAGGFVIAYIWTVKTGQMDDIDTPPHRILIE